MQSTHYLFDFRLKSASKHRWEMAPWFSRALSNAGSCSRLCTQAIVYCTRSSASQRNPEKNKTFTSLPTQSNGPNPLFFSRKRRNLHYTRELTWLWRLNCSSKARQNCSNKTATWQSSTQSCIGNVTHRPWTFPRPCVVFVVIVLAPHF